MNRHRALWITALLRREFLHLVIKNETKKYTETDINYLRLLTLEMWKT